MAPNRTKKARVLTTIFVSVVLAALVVGSFVLPKLIEPKNISLLSNPHTKTVVVKDSVARMVCPPAAIDPTDSHEELSTPALVPGEADSHELKTFGSFYALDPQHTDAAAGQTSAELSVAYIAKGQWRSLLVSPCVAPKLDQYVGAFSTKPDTDAVVILSNPSSKAAQVTIQAYSEKGAETQPYEVSVPAQDTVTWVPASLYPDRHRLTVQVRSEITPVAVWAQVSSHDGEVPKGLTRIAGTQPTVSAAFPFVKESDKYSQAPRLLVTNPNSEPADVSISVIDKKGQTQTLAGAEGFSVDAGAVFGIDLSGVGKNGAAVMVQSSQPVVSSITYSVVGNKDATLGKKVASLSFDIPSSNTETIAVPEVGKLAKKLASLGLEQVKIRAAFLPDDDAPALTVRDQKWLSEHSGESVTVRAAALLVSADTPMGTVEFTVLLGAEDEAEHSAQINVVP